VDALKAAVYRQFDIDHHLHDFVDKNITVIEGDLEDMSKEDLRERIETVIKELSEAKESLDTEEEE
jgi:hypothetical protein